MRLWPERWSRQQEERATLQIPARFLFDAWTRQSTSGISVTPELALSMSAVYACVKVLAESVSTLPFITYRRTGRGKDRDASYYLYDLLNSQPNEEHTAVEFWEFMVASVALRGNGYAIKARDSADRVRELWPLRPDQVTVKRLAGGELAYVWRPDGGAEEVFPRVEVLHLRGFSSNGVTGLSPISLHTEAIGLGMAAEQHGARLFGQGVRPAGHFKHPKSLSPEAHKRLKKSLEDFKGVQNSHKILITEEGMEWNDIGLSPHDAQMLETRKFQISEICRIYRVPPHMVGDLERATFSNIEQQSIDFVIHTLRPWLIRIEQAVRRDIYTETDRKQHVSEFVVEGLLRGDSAARSAFYQSALQNAWLSPNEIRELENRNPYEGGDTYYVQGATIPTSMAGKQLPLPSIASRREKRTAAPELRGLNRRKDSEKAFIPAFTQAFARVLRREIRDIEQQVKKHLGAGEQRNAETFGVWLAEWLENDHLEFVQRELRPVIDSYALQMRGHAEDEVGPALEDGTGWDVFLGLVTVSMARRWIGKSAAQIGAVLEAGGDEAAKEITAKLEGWTQARAAQVAGGETVHAAGALVRKAYADAGVEKIRWVAVGDSCPFCEGMDGKVVGVQGRFQSKGDSLEAEGQNPMNLNWHVKFPPLHGGCDCGIVAA